MNTLQYKRILLLLVSAFLSINANSQNVDRIDSVMKALYVRGQFNGAIIVAVAGKPIFRSAFGETNTKQKFTPATQSNIASLSKGFTAMAIMLLAEQGKLTCHNMAGMFPNAFGARQNVAGMHPNVKG